MSNNLNYDAPASGSPVATEDISSRHYQVMKLGMGATGVHQGDLAFGQATKALSVPVTVASDQEVPMLNRYGKKATYCASTNGVVTMDTAANTTSSLACLWHPSSSNKTVYLQRITVNFYGGSGGEFTVRLARITSDPSASGQTVRPASGADPATTCTFQNGPFTPVRETGDHATYGFAGNDAKQIDLLPILEGKGWICRSGQAEGWEVRSVAGSGALTTTPRFTVSYSWTEED